jgi:hypothetical protein
MTIRTRSEAGFSLLEVLVSTAIMLTVTGAIFTLLNPAGSMFQAQPEVVDMQQRMRIGVDTLTRDLVMAGAGAYPAARRATSRHFSRRFSRRARATIRCRRWSGTFFSDRITIFYVPTTSGQTTIENPMPTVSAELKVTDETGCPLDSGGHPQNLCGFKEGDNVLIYDDTGAYDTMTITQVQDAAAHLQHNQQGDLSKQYGPGAKVVQYQDHVYFLDAAARQLKHYDGFHTITPVLDEVVGLSFEYFGDGQPPRMLDNTGLTGQDVTYGPKPKALGSPAVNDWPSAENCIITTTAPPNQTQVPRLADLGPGLVKLTAGQLTDGPWCPDAMNSNRFDADLHCASARCA